MLIKLIPVPVLVLLVLSNSYTLAAGNKVSNYNYINNNWLSSEESEILDNLSLVLHRNTEAEACGSSNTSLLDAINFIAKSSNLRALDKYTFESLLSTALGVLLLPHDTCSGENEDLMPGLASYCDMGSERTVKQPDHDLLVPIMLHPDSNSLPCHFHTREGLRITSFKMLIDATKGTQEKNAEQCNQSNDQCQNTKSNLHLYAVPAGRVFMFAPSFIGETFDLSHVLPTNNIPLRLETLSLSPRVFEIHNFFTKAEGETIMNHILQETNENLKLKRSSTGATGYTVNPMRTSEGGFDTHSPHAIELKTRCFKVLGFEEYNEVYADGLQVLRYNQTKGYIDHDDYLDDNTGMEEHDYDSAGVGTNRFATILMYFNDVPDGGETVFPEVWAPTQAASEHIPLNQAIQQFRETPYSKQFQQGSWEETLTAKCKTKFAIKPKATRAILFYSQKSDGSLDVLSKHGACPILNGTKWAANLWVWSGPMNGPHEPVNYDHVVENMKNGRPTSHPQAITGIFRNVNHLPEYNDAELYYGDQFWGRLGDGSNEIAINTFYGHRWDVYVGNRVVKSWTVGYGDTRQYFDL